MPNEPEPVLSQRLLTKQEFLATFQFSQGAPLVQEMLFQYLKLADPRLCLPRSIAEQVALDWSETAYSIVATGRRHYSAISHDQTYDEVEYMLGQASAALSQPNSESRTSLVSRLSEAVASRDKRFYTVGGRDYTGILADHYNPHTDLWRSDLCYYGLLGHSTGIPLFDTMFQEIATYTRAVLAAAPQRVFSQDVQHLISVFNQHHPSMSVAV